MRLLCGKSLLEVLTLRLVNRPLGLLTHAKRRHLRFLSKLTGLQTLLKRLLLSHVLRGLRGQRLLEILRQRFVVKAKTLCAQTKLLLCGLVGKVGQRLLLGQPLLTHGGVERNALQRGLGTQVVFTLRLQFHFGVVRLAAWSQALVDKALF